MSASKCGFTPQYEGLEAVYEAHAGRGLVVCGFPANDFSGQEPGSNAEIQTFCTGSFGVKFPMYSKIFVTGAERHPLYSALIEGAPETTGDTADLRQHLVEFGAVPTAQPEVLWNFEKFLVGRDGRVVGAVCAGRYSRRSAAQRGDRARAFTLGRFHRLDRVLCTQG